MIVGAVLNVARNQAPFQKRNTIVWGFLARHESRDVVQFPLKAQCHAPVKTQVFFRANDQNALETPMSTALLNDGLWGLHWI